MIIHFHFYSDEVILLFVPHNLKLAKRVTEVLFYPFEKFYLMLKCIKRPHVTWLSYTLL